MTPPNSLSKFSKACARALVDFLLRVSHTKLPPYFSIRDRLSYLIHGLEPSIVKVAASILRPGDTVVDIGANVGFLTREFASLVGHQGKVLAFEPEPVTFDFLQCNTQRLPQVSVFQEAMSDHIGKMSFHLHPTSGMSNSLVNAWKDGRTIQVSTSTLDAWAKDNAIADVRLVKIDVEGAELLVLRGMQGILKERSGLQLIFEFCPKNLGGRDVEVGIFDLLREHGYSLFLIETSGQLHSVANSNVVHRHLNRNDYANLLARRE
jgi:FkbM family methyltransferase